MSLNPKFALFAVAHPDDEILGPGNAIAEHVAARDVDGLPVWDVHVLIMGRSVQSRVRDYLDGTAVSSWWGVMHNPAAEGYTPPTDEEFGAARMAESRAALDALTSGLGTLTLHEGGLEDGYSSDVAAAAILALCNSITAGPVALKGHSWLVDNHPDHLAIGNAIKTLATQNPARFAGPRYYVLPRYWSDSRLTQVGAHWDDPTDVGIRNRVINACRCFGAWLPPSFAIGHHSVWSDMFKPLMDTPRSMYHT